MTQAVSSSTKERRVDWSSYASQFGALIVLIVIVVIFWIVEPAFFTERNIFNVLRQVSIYGLLGIGMTFVILTGGIDLSIGSLLALAGLVAAWVYKVGVYLLFAGSPEQAESFALPAAIATAVGIGIAGGLVQGSAVRWLKVPPFIVTLGGLAAFRGLALLFSSGQPISTFREDYSFWGQGMVGPVPVPVIIYLVFAVLAGIVLRLTRYGRHVYAVGGNQEAARLSGLNIGNVLMSVYVISGFFAGFCGFLLSSRLNSSEAVAGVGYELTVIASVVIGGTSLFGGEGGIFGTVIGILLIGVLNNGLTLMNVSPYLQQVLIGLIIVFAVFFDQFVKRRRR
jgi:ribose/xylose/arabinose/galactoside ABC-type transport system permease subunit